MSAQRRPLLTRALFQIHLWLGLALGVYAVLIGLTGSILVFSREIRETIAPKPVVAPPDAPARLETIRAGVQARYPEWHPWSLEAPAEPDAPWGSYLLRPGGGMMVFADSSGQVVGESRAEGTWFDLVQQFHSFLLLPYGRLLNGAAGLMLAVLAVTGLILWWPGRGEWPEAFRIVRRSGWKGIVYDLHRVGGVLSFVFVVLFGITGGYFTWPAAYRQIIARVLPTNPQTAPPRVETTGDRLAVDEIVASAERALPGTTLVRVLLPRGGRQPVTVVLAHGTGEPDRMHRTSQLLLNPHTGEVMTVDDYRERRAGDYVAAWMGPLHTGHFGGLGVRVAYAVAGLTLPALFVTGFLMWINRVVAPRMRRRTRRV
jgi:uncharacterized iron-regulated membrane protein